MQKIVSLLPDIKTRVNVGLHEPVKEEDVKWLHETFDGLVTEIIPKGAGSATEGSKKDAPGSK